MTRRRFELTDEEWVVIEPLLPNKVRGVPRVDDRRVINGILWRFRTGSLGPIWKTQTCQRLGYTLRQTRRQLPRRHQALLHTPMDRR